MTIKFDNYTKLHEVLEYISEPFSFLERVDRTKEVCQKSQAFEFFIKELFKPTLQFNKIKEYQTIRLTKQNGKFDTYDYGILAQRFILENLPIYDDSSEGNIRIKHSHLLQDLDEMDFRDGMIFKEFIEGNLIIEKLNKLVAREVFGEDFLGE